MQKNSKLTRKWYYSIEAKLIAGFGIVTVIILVSSYLLYSRAMKLSRQTIYEKMYSQAEYYLNELNQEIEHIKQLQIDFFNDRNLTFLITPDMNINDYERREKLLSVQERLYTITGVSDLVEEGLLYLPKSGYKITASKVDRMTSKDTEDISGYRNSIDGMQYEDGNFFMVQSGAPQINSDTVPNHILIIKLSGKKIRERLARLVTSEGSGAFLYDEKNQAIIEHDAESTTGNEIMAQLAADEAGNYASTQRLKIRGNSYLVFVGGYGALGLFVEYNEESSVIRAVSEFRNLMYVLFVLMFFFAILFAVYARELIHRPISILLDAFQRIQAGNWSEHITHSRNDEFSYLYEGFNEMEDRMEDMIEQVYVQTNLAQRAQLKQLQAQIAPHFLYNSFFSLSRKIKRGDYENAEELARHLGTYFKYLTRNESDYVPLRQEVEHAGSYAAIQGTRFSNRITVDFENAPADFMEIIVPRLVLQPLLENAFHHGLENKIKDGILSVHFEETEEEYRILVEDNGDTPDEVLERMNRGLDSDADGEITGIYNIHRRLGILYHRQAGIRIGRSRLGGVCVVMFIRKGARMDESEFVNRR